MEQIKCEMKQEGLSMEVDRQQFAMALKTWRLRTGLTQRQLADRWGTNRYAIMHAESGRAISWEHAYKLFAKLSGELRKEAENG